MDRERGMVVTGAAARDDGAEAIGTLVSRVELVGGLLPIGGMLVCVGLPLLIGIARGHALLAVANALLLGFVGTGLCLLLQLLVLQPAGSFLYRRAAGRLAEAIRCRASGATWRTCWTDHGPGAIAVIPHHSVWLADRSTGFRVVALDVADILVVEPVSDVRMSRGRAAGPMLGIGFPLGGGLMGTIGIGRSPKPPRIRVRHGLSLQYLAGTDPRLRSTLVPFGSDLHAARIAAAMIARSAVASAPDV